MPEGYKSGAGVVYIKDDIWDDAEDVDTSVDWVRLRIQKSPKLDLSHDEAEVDDDESDFTRYLHGKSKAPLEIEISRKIGNAAYAMLRNAFITKKVIGVGIASGDIEDADRTLVEEIFLGNWIVTAFPVGNAPSETNMVTVKFGLAANVPTGSGAPGFFDVALPV